MFLPKRIKVLTMNAHGRMVKKKFKVLPGFAADVVSQRLGSRVQRAKSQRTTWVTGIAA